MADTTNIKGSRLTREEVLQQAEEARVRFVHLQFTDVVGIVKGVTLPVDQLEDAMAHGVWFDGSSIAGFARIAESDMYLVPDPSTFALVPWESGDEVRTARILCDVYTPHGDPFAGDPRQVLRRMMNEAAQMGFVYNTGPELEFFLFHRDQNGYGTPSLHDQGGYFDQSTDRAVEVRKYMVNALKAFGIRVEASHHEVAPGQHEIDFEYADALHAADNAVTFKYALKAVAGAFGLHATFMPKPIAGINGSGMHVHQSLAYLDSGKNAFADPSDRYGLSAVARHFIAGQMAHARGMCAVLSPLVNSYKRLVPGYEAPVYISWARINRSALLRVPQVSPAKVEQTRVELRCPDPSCNPYLAFAVMLAAGLDGIRRKLEPPESAEEDLYHLPAEKRQKHKTLPGSLWEALQELQRDEVIKEALGSHAYEKFVEAKTREWDEYRTCVHPWELERYLNIY
ncbi:MAG: glutamine synthetase family protein [Anaerolineae bacterium]|nr:glutamine synthetase family protein [Anaerolineae bacterium]